MRKLMFVLLLGMLGGCYLPQAPRTPESTSTQPIVTGTLVSCNIYDRPVPRQGETGSSFFQTVTSGTIDIYDNFVVVTDAEGNKYAAPMDWVSGIQFK